MKTIKEIIKSYVEPRSFVKINYPAIAKEICEEIERMMEYNDDEDYTIYFSDWQAFWQAFKKANGVE